MSEGYCATLDKPCFVNVCQKCNTQGYPVKNDKCLHWRTYNQWLKERIAKMRVALATREARFACYKCKTNFSSECWEYEEPERYGYCPFCGAELVVYSQGYEVIDCVNDKPVWGHVVTLRCPNDKNHGVER